MSLRTTQVVAAIAVQALTIACGGSQPASPTPPGGKTATLTFRVYNSATGEIPGAGFTRTVQADAVSGLFPAVSISVSALKVAGVDPLRAVLRVEHQSDRIAPLIDKTTDGTLVFQPFAAATYDLFLMNAANGVSYDCLDYTEEAGRGATSAFPDLHRVTTGTIYGCPIADGPDGPFQTAVDQFNDAMNPFGLRYGFIDYRGADAMTGLMTGGWSNRAVCQFSAGGNGMLVAQQDDKMTPENRAWLVAHELAHAYLGAPDYYHRESCFGGGLTCALVGCPPTSAYFTPAGKDAVRYWALTDSRMRGR